MFCSKCGTQLPDDSSFCNNCGAPQGNAIPQAVQGTSPVAVAPAQPSPIVLYLKKVWDYIQNFFIKDPSNAIQQAHHETTPIWYALTAGLWLLGLGAMLALVQGIGNIPIHEGISLNAQLAETKAQMKEYAEYMGDIKVPGSFLEIVGFWRVFLFSFILILGTYAVKVGGTWVCATKIVKTNVTLPSLLNSAGMAELPIVASLVLATILCFIWYPLGLFVLVIGAIVSAVMYCELIKTTGILGEKPVWFVSALLCITTIAFCLLAYWALTYWVNGIVETISSITGSNFDISDIMGMLN